jgi:hypothetical protein
MKYIDKHGNIQEFSGTEQQKDLFVGTLEYIGGTYFEPKELLEVETKEEKEEKEIELELGNDELSKYKKLLKEAGIK